jgi:hypothetical protein
MKAHQLHRSFDKSARRERPGAVYLAIRVLRCSMTEAS